MMRPVMGWVTALIGFMLSAPVHAEFPERPITILVAYDAGGATDTLAQMLAPYIEKHLGSGAHVEVRLQPGAGGEIGFQALVKAKPDGYTIGFINTPNLLTIPIDRDAQYRLGQLDPLINVVDDPCVWSVDEGSPFGTLADVIAYARTNPGLITVGSTGIASDDHLAMLQMEHEAKVKFRHVPFPGGGARNRALNARRIVVAGQNLGEALSDRAKGRTRILALMSANRWPAAPDIPTATELGFPIVMGSMRGIAAPVGIPSAIRQKLVRALLMAAADPEFVAKASDPITYQALRVLGPAEFSHELISLDQKFRALWQNGAWVRAGESNKL